MAKYKTGTIYSGRANVRFMTEKDTRIEVVTIGGAVSEKDFDRQLKMRYDYEDGDKYTYTRRIGDIEKVGAKYRVLTAELMLCPSFEVTDYDGAEQSTDDCNESDD